MDNVVCLLYFIIVYYCDYFICVRILDTFQITLQHNTAADDRLPACDWLAQLRLPATLRCAQFPPPSAMAHNVRFQETMGNGPYHPTTGGTSAECSPQKRITVCDRIGLQTAQAVVRAGPVLSDLEWSIVPLRRES